MSAVISHVGSNSVIRLMTRVSLLDKVFTGSEPPGNYLFAPLASDFYPFGDPIPSILEDSIWDNGDVDSEFLIGITSQDLTRRRFVEVEGFKPLNRRFNASHDYNRYGNLLSELAVLRSNQRLAKARFRRDHEVLHHNLVGEVIPETDYTLSQDWYTTAFVEWGWVLPGIASSPLGVAGVNVKAHTALTYSLPLGPTSTSGFGDVYAGRSMLGEVVDTLNDFTWIGGSTVGSRLGLNRGIVDFSSSISGDVAVIKYDYVLKESNSSGWGEALWNCEILLSRVPHEPHMSRGPSGTAGAPNYLVNVQYTYRPIYHTWSVDGTEYHESDAVWRTSEATLQPMMRSNCSSDIKPDVSTISLQLREQARNFGLLHDRELEHFRPAAFYSTADAVEDHLLSLKNNYLETLSEIPEIVRLLPDISILIEAMLLFRSQPGASLKKFGDFFSGFLLKYNFGWSPNASAVEELNRWGPNALKSFDRFLNPSSIQLAGRFDYKLPDHLYWGERYLTVRSTVMLEYVDSEFANKVLNLDSVGLLPDLHRVWEVLPYSFAIDWFTRLGRRMNDIDTSVKMFSLMRVHWVQHTYQVTGTLPPSLDLSSVDEDRSSVKMKWYARELSLRIPPLRDGKYDFRQATTLPNIGTLLSLGWQKAT